MKPADRNTATRTTRIPPNSAETASIRRIQKVILGQTLTSGTDGGSGNRALGGVHNDVRIDKRNSDIQLVTPTVQAMVDALLVWNGYAPGDVVFSMSDGKGLENRASSSPSSPDRRAARAGSAARTASS